MYFLRPKTEVHYLNHTSTAFEPLFDALRVSCRYIRAFAIRGLAAGSNVLEQSSMTSTGANLLDADNDKRTTCT